MLHSKKQPIIKPAPCMRDNHSLRIALRRLSRITAVLTVLFLACRPEVGWTQAPPSTLTYDGPSESAACGDSQCCQEFTMTINSADPSQDGQIMLISDGASNACINSACFVAQSISGIVFEYAGDPDGVYTINVTGYTGMFPYTFSFSLCAPQECWEHFPEILSGTGNGPAVKNQTYLCDGGGGVSDCGTCDRVDVGNSDCMTDVCFEHFSNNPLSSFTLHFTPPLEPCNYNILTGTVCPGFSAGIAQPLGWTYTLAGSDGMGDYSELVFTANSGYAFTGCGEVCIQIPQCPTTHSTTVTVTDGYECIDSGASWPVPLKQADGGGMGAVPSGPEQNYPNPVDASSGFKTTIPFTTSASGIATIRIVDQTGKEVMKDNEEATYVGEHFFYFTASDLPSGTYYYQIEFPQGVIIQNKTMLVVK
jgi:hypothetical protein